MNFGENFMFASSSEVFSQYPAPLLRKPRRRGLEHKVPTGRSAAEC